MAAQPKHISHWFIITLLLLVTSLLWFFIDVTKSKRVNFATKTAEVAAKPVKNSFNEAAIESIQSRFVIPRIDLAKIEPYTSNSAAKSVSINTVRKLETLPVQVQEIVASGSGQIETQAQE